jgi:hypothetical protein
LDIEKLPSMCVPVVTGRAPPALGAKYTFDVPVSPTVKYTPLLSVAQVRSPTSRSRSPDSFRAPLPSTFIAYSSWVW